MTPPRLARAFLRQLALEDDRDYLVGDLDEEYAERAAHGGHRSASRWYLQQVMLSIPSLLRLRFDRRNDPMSAHAPMFADLRYDIRDALRRVRRAPTSALTIVLISALGIGASTAVYTVVHAVLIAPLPFAGAARVVKVENRVPALASEASYLPSDNWLDYVEFKSRARSFEALAAIWEGGRRAPSPSRMRRRRFPWRSSPSVSTTCWACGPCWGAPSIGTNSWRGVHASSH